MSLIASGTLVNEVITPVNCAAAADSWINLIHVGPVSVFLTENTNSEKVLVYKGDVSGAKQIYITDQNATIYLVGHASASTYTITST